MPKRFPLRISALLLLLAGSMFASEHRGVVQFGGLPVPGATVTATQGDKKVTAITDDTGVYTFKDLADGTWTVEVQMLVFDPVKREIAVPANAEQATWDLKAQPISTFPATAAAQAEKAPAASVAVAAAPVKGKAGFQKAEVKASAPANQIPAEPPAPAGDANQSATDAFAINGSVNNGAASAFGQSAAFGNARKGVGGMIHGGLGVMLDNSYLDARSFSLTGQDTSKPVYNHLQVTGNLGGPLVIPHLNIGKNWNFFLGYQLTRNRNASVQPGLMPTVSERAGNIAPGIVVPASRISPQASALLALYPLPNFTSNSGYNYQVPLTGTAHQNGIQTRINKTIDQKNQAYGVFAWQTSENTNENLFGFVDATAVTGYNATLNFSHRFGSKFFAHFQYQFSRYSVTTTPFFANRENISGQAGITGNNQAPINWGPPQLSFSSGIASLADAQDSAVHNQTGAFTYDTYWSHRSHNVTWGADYKRQQFNNISQQNPRGSFYFNGAATGNDFQDFLLGIPDTSSIAYGNADKYFRSSLYDAYITDDWRVGRGLSINVGARWEYSAPITELYGRLVNLEIAPGYSAVTPVVAANRMGKAFPDSLVAPDKRQIQPRVALSWRPFPDSSMVIRAGYGIYANTSVYQSIASQMAQQSPLSKTFSVANSSADPLTLANGFNASPLTTQNTFAIDRNFRVGYAHNWQISMQRDLPGSLVLIATYLGIKGTRGVQEFLPNTYPSGAANPCPTCPSGYVYMTSNGNSTRESGQVQLRRRLHNGFTASATYTFAKAIDDAALGGRGQGGSVIAQNWLNLAGERGLSNFDQRHLLTSELQYSSGTGLRGGTLMGGWRGRLLKEWTLVTQIKAGTGLPETPVYTPGVVSGTGVSGSIRPNYPGAPLYAAPAGRYLNPAAYATPSPGQWGNAGRDTITGPNQFGINQSMSRTFRLTDRFNADLRIDATNALNHVVIGAWNTNVSSSQFGLPVNANPMRSLQATLRVRF